MKHVSTAFYTFSLRSVSLSSDFIMFDSMEKLVTNGNCEIVSIARPLIQDPFLIKHFYDGKLDAAECQSCNQCFIYGGSRHVSGAFLQIINNQKFKIKMIIKKKILK